MNKNSKNNFNQAKKNAAHGQKSTDFSIPKVLDGRGESSQWGAYRKKTINFCSKPRINKKPKVAASGSKNKKDSFVSLEEIDTAVDTTTMPVNKILKAVQTIE